VGLVFLGSGSLAQVRTKSVSRISISSSSCLHAESLWEPVIPEAGNVEIYPGGIEREAVQRDRRHAWLSRSVKLNESTRRARPRQNVSFDSTGLQWMFLGSFPISLSLNGG